MGAGTCPLWLGLMPLNPFQVFTLPATVVDSQAPNSTLIFDQQTVQSNTAKLAVDMSVTPFTASSVTPVLLLSQAQRMFFNVISASDGLAFYVGTSVGMTPATSALVSQGSRLKVTGYIGPVYVLGASGASVSLFYQTG